MTDRMTTHSPTDSIHASVVERLSRIADAVGAQRCELYRFAANGHAVLSSSWDAAGRNVTLSHDGLHAGWFPWSIGNLKPTRYLFVRNAASLPVSPDHHESIGDLGFDSALHLPIHDGLHLVGAICVYWCDTRTEIEAALLSKVEEDRKSVV